METLKVVAAAVAVVPVVAVEEAVAVEVEGVKVRRADKNVMTAQTGIVLTMRVLVGGIILGGGMLLM